MTSAVLPVYNRNDLMFERGEGPYLYTAEGERYLDFAAGIAVNSLGHSHPHLVEALVEQGKKLWHVSNVFQIQGLETFAKRLTDATCTDYAFFCNSGAEALECTIKMVRKYHSEKGNKKYRIITFTNSFHGRTMATISASAREKVLQGFEPALDGFDNVEFGDIDAVKKAITPETGGILLEPIQGEGGIRVADKAFLQGLRDLADEHDLLLCFDEVQCGMGRTGTLFAYQQSGIEPDIIASAKGIGGGFPLGACLATQNAASGMKAGTHGSTYGSNPLAMSVGNAVLDIILEPGFLDHVQEVSSYLIEQLNQISSPIIEEVRGVGLMIGLKVTVPNREFAAELRTQGLLSVPASDNVIRMLPPLIITKDHVDEAISKINKACEEYNASS